IVMPVTTPLWSPCVWRAGTPRHISGWLSSCILMRKHHRQRRSVASCEGVRREPVLHARPSAPPLVGAIRTLDTSHLPYRSRNGRSRDHRRLRPRSEYSDGHHRECRGTSSIQIRLALPAENVVSWRDEGKHIMAGIPHYERGTICYHK